MALDAALVNIQTLTDQGETAILRQNLATVSSELAANARQIPTALESLDARRHSLGYLYLLGHFVQKSEQTPEEVDLAITLTSQYLAAFNSDPICNHKDSIVQLVTLCRSFTATCVEAKRAQNGVLPILEALRKIQPAADYLTPMHAMLAQLCLLAHTHNIAVPVLMEDVFEVDPALTGMTARDFQLYCYYGGLLLAASGKHTRALELFMHGLTAPAMLPSAITLEIYKKYILVSLIATGTAPVRLPRYAPMAVQRLMKNTAQRYTELAEAAAPGAAPTKLNALLTEHADTFANDGNAGLVAMLRACTSRRCIQRLTQTYITLSLADIASQAGLSGAAEAEMTVLRMIGDGEIHARIDDKAGMVQFCEDPTDYKSMKCVSVLSERVKECISLAERMRGMNDAVSANAAYINQMELRSHRYAGDVGGSNLHPMPPAMPGSEAALPAGLQ